MEVNDYQVGGDHYNKRKYQHWDMVIDTGMHYVLACATKYVSRWRDKNGVEDLRKCAQYISKAVESNISGLPANVNDKYEEVDRFAKQHDKLLDSEIIKLISFGFYGEATDLLNVTIRNIEAGRLSAHGEPTSSYTNQDR